MPEGIRVILSRPSGKKRIQGVKRKKKEEEEKGSPRYGPQDARHCFWRILHLSSFKL